MKSYGSELGYTIHFEGTGIPTREMDVIISVSSLLCYQNAAELHSYGLKVNFYPASLWRITVSCAWLAGCLFVHQSVYFSSLYVHPWYTVSTTTLEEVNPVSLNTCEIFIMGEERILFSRNDLDLQRNLVLLLMWCHVCMVTFEQLNPALSN